MLPLILHVALGDLSLPELLLIGVKGKPWFKMLASKECLTAGVRSSPAQLQRRNPKQRHPRRTRFKDTDRRKGILPQHKSLEAAGAGERK